MPTKDYRPCFQLSAAGDSLGGWKFRATSKAIFMHYESAEAYIPRFKEKCCDPSSANCADPETLEIKVVELELYDR
jgi:hypothetical protein